MDRPFKKVLVVGAGPSGLLLALLLSKQGIQVEILEAEDHLDQQPRAAIYGTPAIPEFHRAGILDEMRRRGMVLNRMTWRRHQDFTPITGLNNEAVSNLDGLDMRPTTLVLPELDQLMLDRALENGATIQWEHKVVDIGQDDGKAWAEVETKEGTKTIEADYIVGCDGANSQIRKCLFGNDFPGFTWDSQIIATNTYYDFEGKFGFHDTNFIIHPENFFMAAKLTKDKLYRITYGDIPGLTLEQYKERQPAKFETMLPGHPKPDEYKIVNIAPYKMHQRCAPAFRVGRALLVADAAHICNPWGGLGITGGFVDVGGLADCLIGIWEGKADDSILDLYSEKRIEKWKTVIDVISQDNFRRVSDKDPDTLFERDEFLQIVKQAESDDTAMRDLILGSMDVRYDFTQHYKK
ncbi:FAD binding domain-containing protein [Thozetella sp. PMI_491]|nr:FAD binding domain-containing protein [Thozetella sp. PMI_491]